MFRKLTIALAATAALSAVALAPTAASAKPSGSGFHHHRHVGGFRIGVGYVDNSCYATRRVLTHRGYRLRTVNVCAYRPV